MHHEDIANFDPTPYSGQAELIVGGPPCQGFSALGKRRPDDPRNLLWREYLRVVKTVQPKIFVLENVSRFLKSDQFADLKAATDKNGKFREYELAVKVVNAADYGIPQARRRAIVIATHRDLPQLKHPAPTHSKKAISVKNSEPPLFAPDGRSVEPHRWVSVENVFTRTNHRKITEVNLPANRHCAPLDVEVPGTYKTTELHIGRNPSPLSRARYERIRRPGGNRNDLRNKTADIMGNGVLVPLSTASWDRHNSGSGDVMGRLYPDRPSVTIRTEFFKPEKGRYLHPFENRPITHYEAALIQGFPDDYQWCGTKIQIARQIGNAVPVGLGRVLAAAIHKHLRG